MNPYLIVQKVAMYPALKFIKLFLIGTYLLNNYAYLNIIEPIKHASLTFIFLVHMPRNTDNDPCKTLLVVCKYEKSA